MKKTLMFVLAALALAGCTQTQEALKDVDRNYAATYDADTGRVGGKVTWTPAATPGAGKPSASIEVTGSLNGGDGKSVLR